MINCISTCKGMFGLGLFVAFGIFYISHIIDILISEKRQIIR